MCFGQMRKKASGAERGSSSIRSVGRVGGHCIHSTVLQDAARLPALPRRAVPLKTLLLGPLAASPGVPSHSAAPSEVLARAQDAATARGAPTLVRQGCSSPRHARPAPAAALCRVSCCPAGWQGVSRPSVARDPRLTVSSPHSPQTAVQAGPRRLSRGRGTDRPAARVAAPRKACPSPGSCRQVRGPAHCHRAASVPTPLALCLPSLLARLRLNQTPSPC